MVCHRNTNTEGTGRYLQSENVNIVFAETPTSRDLKSGDWYLPPGGYSRTLPIRVFAPGGYSHTLPIRVCAAQRGHDFEAPDLERGIHFRGVV